MRATKNNEDLGRPVATDDDVFFAADLLRVQLSLKREDGGSLYKSSAENLNRMLEILTRHQPITIGENEPFDVGCSLLWERRETTQDGVDGVLIRGVIAMIAQKFVPHNPDGTPASDELNIRAVAEVVGALVEQVKKFGESEKLRGYMINAVRQGKPATSERVLRMQERFQIYGGVGGTLEGREHRRDTLQRDLKDGKQVARDPAEPSAPAEELRCPPLSVESKSPKSLLCPCCGRGVGGLGKDEETQDRRLVNRGGPCSVCKKLCCAYCFFDRGEIGLPPSTLLPSGEIAHDGHPTLKITNLGWACLNCVPRPHGS